MIKAAIYSDIPAIARVHVDSWRSTYRGIVPDEYLANLAYEQREKGWQQIFDRASTTHSFTYVAKNSQGKVVGFANGCTERTGDPVYKGELAAIYLLEPYQGQGIGRSLVQAVAERLAQLKLNSMLVWALRENSACEFYLALEGKQIRQREIEISGRRFVEIAYGWLDTAALRRVDDV